MTGPTETGAFPPDTMGAVGPTQFFVFLNGRLRTFNKTTGAADTVINADPDVFFASVLTTPFMIKLYAGGRFSGLLADGGLAVGDELEVTGPYGVFTLRASSARRLLFIGGGAGMAPVLSLLRSLSEPVSARPGVYYYGARTEADLFHLSELEQLRASLPGFRFVPALSEDCNGWAGERGLITDVVDRFEGDLAGVDAYVCGPPPMVEAAIALLVGRGVPEGQIYFDKFTTTADAE